MGNFVLYLLTILFLCEQQVRVLLEKGNYQVYSHIFFYTLLHSRPQIFTTIVDYLQV